MRRANGLLLLLLLARPVQAVQLWAAWDLDLDDHAPPSHFLLSVTSPTGTPVPPPMTVPWASCTAIANTQHCAPIVCPPTGTYDFTVRAQFAEGLSAPSNTFRCTMGTMQCACSDVTPPGRPQAPRPLAIPPTPVVQGPQVPPGLILLPVGDIPRTAPIPPIPQTAGA